MNSERSLYQCLNAKIHNKKIYCLKGHPMNTNIERAIRGEPLIMAFCQTCSDYDEMGSNLSYDERGWTPSKTDPLKESHKNDWCVVKSGIVCHNDSCDDCNIMISSLVTKLKRTPK